VGWKLEKVHWVQNLKCQTKAFGLPSISDGESPRVFGHKCERGMIIKGNFWDLIPGMNVGRKTGAERL
jgi:hypothetical protein